MCRYRPGDVRSRRSYVYLLLIFARRYVRYGQARTRLALRRKHGTRRDETVLDDPLVLADTQMEHVVQARG